MCLILICGHCYALHTAYKQRVYGLSANPFHHSLVISAVSGNNGVSMWDMETATRCQHARLGLITTPLVLRI